MAATYYCGRTASSSKGTREQNLQKKKFLMMASFLPLLQAMLQLSGEGSKRTPPLKFSTRARDPTAVRTKENF
jgi:hypothetical protein